MTTSSENPQADAARARRWIVFILVLFTLGLTWVAVDMDSEPRRLLRHPAIVDSAYFVFAFWAGAVGLWLTTTAADWQARRGRFRVFRLTWLLGWAMYAVHMAAAFHFAHGWSHAEAEEHVQVSTGFGPGIWASYVLAAFWLVDAAWAWIAAASYVRRPLRHQAVWIGLMAFIMLNATVVFGRGLMQVVCAGIFLALGGAAVQRYRTHVGSRSADA